MRNHTETGSATALLFRFAGVLAVCLGLAFPATIAAQDDLCDDGTAPSAPQLFTDPLPTLDMVSDGCDTSVETPAVRFLVGQDGQTYYIELTESTSCAAADAELSRWIQCWTYEPARCGADAVMQEVEAEISWPVSPPPGQDPPCDRETEVDS